MRTVVFACAVVAVIAAVAVPAMKLSGKRRVPYRWPMMAGLFGVAAAAALFAVLRPVGANEVGLVVFAGDVQGRLESGPHLVAPWKTVVMMDVGQNTSEMTSVTDDGDRARPDAVPVSSKDGTDLLVNTVVVFKLQPDSVEDIYRLYRKKGTDIVESIRDQVVRPETKSTMATAFRDFDALSAKSLATSEIRDDVRSSLTRRLAERGIELISIEMEKPEFASPEQQEALDRQVKAKAEREIAVTEAEKRRIDAESKAEANRILSESLSGPILRQQELEALATAGAGWVVPNGGSQDFILNPPPPAS